MNLVSLQLMTTDDFEKNLAHLKELISIQKKGSFILAPELAITGYAYDRFDEAVEISQTAVKELKPLSKDKTFALTLTTKEQGGYFNTLHIFHKGEVLHKQSKVKLFVMNDEKKYFTPGSEEDIKIVQIDGLKVAAMICFELRYIDFWQKLRGADIILIPAMWGIARKANFETLTQALAVANQCFVLASDSANEAMAKSSAIITPFGNVKIDDNKEVISQAVDLKEIKKMRRYLNIGIK